MPRYARREPRDAAAPADCYTITEFCARHRISKPFYYKLKDQGLGPFEMRFGNRVLISREAAEEWRRVHSMPGAIPPAA